MTFQEWITKYEATAQNLTPMDIRLIEIGWIAGKADSAIERLDAALEASMTRPEAQSA